MMLNISRRASLRALGGGLVVAFALPGVAEALEPPDPTIDLGTIPAEGEPVHLNAYIRIAPNGVVTLRMPAAEMGQGVYTSLPMLLAEELDCDWRTVHAESAPAHEDYDRMLGFFGLHEQLTGGSYSVRMYYDLLRKAGATARWMLVAEAAERWLVDPSSCTTVDGMVRSGDKSATYAELVAGASLRFPPSDVPVKDPSAFRLLGTSPIRLDLPSKVDGTAVFGVDVKIPNMVQGTVLPCPHYGGRVGTVDDTQARAVPGVVDVLVFDQEVVVLAEHFYQAKKAADLVKITWVLGDGAGVDDAAVDAALRAALKRPKTIQKEGDQPAADATATLVSEYAVPYLDHATMEPMSAAAHVTADRVDIWTGTQIQTRVRKMAAKMAKMPLDQVFVHNTMLGGGFGRRSEPDVPRVVLQTAIEIDRPVKLIWTREATFTRGALRPAALARMSATVVDGALTHIQFAAAAQNTLERFVPAFLARGKLGAMLTVEGLAEGPYKFPAIHVGYGQVKLPITTGWWRSVHGSFGGFFRECFLDEVAGLLKKDPLALRRELLKENPRFLAVLDLAVDRAGVVPAGLSRGYALFESFGSIVAEVADVVVEAGVVKVKHVTAAIDCGRVVHPDTVKGQVMGALIMGLSMTLGERLSFKDGAAQERNFHQYPLMNGIDAPTVDVHIISSTEPPGGVGEPGLPPIPAAVCNAIFAATGKRIRTLPIGNQLA